LPAPGPTVSTVDTPHPYLFFGGFWNKLPYLPRPPAHLCVRDPAHARVPLLLCHFSLTPPPHPHAHTRRPTTPLPRPPSPPPTPLGSQVPPWRQRCSRAGGRRARGSGVASFGQAGQAAGVGAAGPPACRRCHTLPAVYREPARDGIVQLRFHRAFIISAWVIL
jgi:hypothetical protein